MEDIYISMLKIGRDKLSDGLTNQELVDELNKVGFNNMSVYNTLLTRYFYEIFFSGYGENSYPPNQSTRFYLKPERYMQLLEYENMLASRKEAKNAKSLAIIAIFLTLIALLVDILK